MELHHDKIRILIRERGMREILDLALHVFRKHALAIIAIYVCTALPVALLNGWLLPHPTWVRSSGFFYFSSVSAYEFGYIWHSSILVFLELPLVAAPVTIYLGKILFEERPERRTILHDLKQAASQLIWSQLLLRWVLIGGLLDWLSHRPDSGIWEFLLFLVTIYVAAVRGFRPYLVEIILLEQNPWKRSQKKGPSTSHRSYDLQHHSGGLLFSRWLMASFVAMLLTCAILFSFELLWTNLINPTVTDFQFYALFLPGTMWIVGLFMTIVRFLGFLDLRIRREGWEVELRLRTEAARLTEQLL